MIGGNGIQNVAEIGGGICKVATALYNSALVSEFNIVEVEKHSYPVTYVELGRDVYISSEKDLKFISTASMPIYIEAYVEDKELVVNFYGKDDYRKYDNVELETNIIKTIPMLEDELIYDENLKPGDRIDENIGMDGYEVELYKKCYINNEMVNYEKVSRHEYLATGNIVRVAVRPY